MYTTDPWTPPLALDLLKAVPDVDPATRFFLRCIHYLDLAGAGGWNPRWIAVVTFLVLGSIQRVCGKRYGIDWYALLHACVSSGGCLVMVYLNFTLSEPTTGYPEMLRSVRCGPPLTSLHRILTAITMGYSLLDLSDGWHLGASFLVHGIATFVVMAYYNEVGAPHMVAPMLLMEVSTVFLNLVKADFLNETGVIVVQGLFAVTFFVFRLVVSPYLYIGLMIDFYREMDSNLFRSCRPQHLVYATGFGGFFYTVLNAYWFYRIVRKIQRKLSGREAVKGNNELNENRKRQ